jgi:hypothetical protein
MKTIKSATSLMNYRQKYGKLGTENVTYLDESKSFYC